MILRPVGFTFRGKLEDPRWRNVWDWALFVGGAVPALLFGVAFGNLLLGVLNAMWYEIGERDALHQFRSDPGAG